MTVEVAGEAVWARALDVLAAAPTVALACHVSPDGDALGSMLALAMGLQRRGVSVTCSFAGAPEVADTYRFLPGQQLLVPEEDFPAAPAVLVTLDTASVERLDTLAPAARAAGELVVVDHHERGDGYGSIRLVDTTAAATAVVVAALIGRLGVALDEPVATCLYTGLSADTGSFKYAATTPTVHLLAARLLAAGARHEEVARALWDNHPYGYVQLLGRVCERAALEPEEAGGRGLVWTVVRVEDLKQFGLRLADAEPVIDTVRTAAEAEVAVVLKEDVDGTFKVSTRSKGAVDVGGVCAALGGGGHRFAAGYTSTEDVAGTLRRLRAALAGAAPAVSPE